MLVMTMRYAHLPAAHKLDAMQGLKPKRQLTPRRTPCKMGKGLPLAQVLKWLNYLRKKMTLTFSSWNQILHWLREMDVLRQALAA